MNLARSADEHFVEGVFDKTRIYHRYRIRGLREKTRTGTLRTYRQASLRYRTQEERVAIIESLWADNQPPQDVWVRKFQELIDEDASQEESSITPVLPSRYQGFTQYLAEHEERVKGLFHVLDADVRNPIQVFKFGVFGPEQGDSNIFLINSRVEIADSFLKRFVRNSIVASHSTIDLQKLAASGQTRIRGGSFRIRNNPTLKSAMIYGPQVNENDNWAQFSHDGTLQFVHLELEVRGRDISLRVTSRGSLMPYQIDDIGEQLTLVTEIYETYLKQFEGPEVLLR